MKKLLKFFRQRFITFGCAAFLVASLCFGQVPAPINIANYGAVCDGRTNDAPAINKAIRAAKGKQIAQHLKEAFASLPQQVSTIYARADSGFYCWEAIKAYQQQGRPASYVSSPRSFPSEFRLIISSAPPKRSLPPAGF